MEYKIYIAGAVTFAPKKIYKKRFNEAENMLLKENYEVFNPIKNVPEGTTWQEAMKICLKNLPDCDAVYLTKGWKKSNGARLERYLAQKIGIEIYTKKTIHRLFTKY